MAGPIPLLRASRLGQAALGGLGFIKRGRTALGLIRISAGYNEGITAYAVASVCLFMRLCARPQFSCRPLGFCIRVFNISIVLLLACFVDCVSPTFVLRHDILA